MRKTRKQRSFLKSLLIVIGIFAITGLLFSYKYKSAIETPLDEANTESHSFFVKKGQTAKEIAESLEEEGIIDSSLFFYLYVRSNNLGENIIAGRFLLNPAMTIKDIVTTLSDPSQAEFIITIQEGLRVEDIDSKLVELSLISTGQFVEATKNFNGWEYYDFLNPAIQEKLEVPLEGYIYPDTYFLDPESFSPEDLIYLALDNFETKLQQGLNEVEGSSQLDNYSLHEIVTMASIIENEVFGLEDRKLVSGILWKRLESDWTIGADATLLYITEDRTITAEDLQIDSPYNTRKNLGLPPGPISNPSLESLKAALLPETSEYWFYLTTLDTGEVIYAKTNEEHNTNRVKFLQ